MHRLEYRKVQGIVGEQSFSVVLPKSYALHLGISKGDFVKVSQEQNRIVIEKACPQRKKKEWNPIIITLRNNIKIAIVMTDLRLTLSEKTKQKGLLKDVIINNKTNKIMPVLNHDCKKVIISSIYTDWIKTTNVFEKQAERKGLSSEDTNQILDELDNNYESISEFILNNPKEEDSKQIKTKEVYIRKYSRNGNNIPLSESIVVGGIPNFL